MKLISREDRMMLLVHTAQELSLARDLKSVMQIVRTVARKLTSADGVSFILKEGDLCHYADEDAISPLWKGQKFSMSKCISGWVIMNAKAAIIKDIYKDERVPADVYKATFVKSLAVVPIRTISPIGAIGNYWAREYEPTEDEVQLLQALADLTSVSLENVSVYGELENRIKERTAELELKNKDLEALSYSLSHDLRSPLRAINHYTSTIKEKFLEDGIAEAAAMSDKVLKKVTVMNDLISELVTFFTVSEENVQSATVLMEAMVTEICKDLKDEHKHQQIEIFIHKLPDAYGDTALLKQVWMNLISNAIKYSSKKKKSVIEIGSFTQENGNIYYIKDNGAGFDNNDRNKLFKVLIRLHGKKEFEGSGLGLAIVERIVLKHGGRVWADGEVDKGATFFFSLPFKEIQTHYYSITPSVITESLNK